MRPTANPGTQRHIARTLWILFGAVWAVLIFYSSTTRAGSYASETFDRYLGVWFGKYRLSGTALQGIEFAAEKTFHVLLFLIFGIVLWNGFPRRHRSWGNVIAAGAIVGISSEVLQMFFPGRDPTIRDALLNIAGTAGGIAVCSLASRLLRSQSTSGT